MNTNIETETANADETKSEDGKRSCRSCPDWMETLHRLWGEDIVLVSAEEVGGRGEFSQDAWQ